MRPGLHNYDSIEATGFDHVAIGFLMGYVSSGLTGSNRILYDFSGHNWQDPAGYPDKKWGEPGRDIYYKQFPTWKFNKDVDSQYGCIGIITGAVGIMQARVKTFDGVKKGDDLAINGTYDGNDLSSLNYLNLSTGTTWGNFDKIAAWKPATGNYTWKMIIGKWRN